LLQSVNNSTGQDVLFYILIIIAAVVSPLHQKQPGKVYHRGWHLLELGAPAATSYQDLTIAQRLHAKLAAIVSPMSEESFLNYSFKWLVVCVYVLMACYLVLALRTSVGGDPKLLFDRMGGALVCYIVATLMGYFLKSEVRR
jgi:hypothetical protein